MKLKIRFLLVVSMIALLGLSTTNVASSVEEKKSNDLVFKPAVQQEAPVFYSIQPAMSMYGYLPGTTVNISYITLNGDTPWLMGSGNGLDWAIGAAFNSSFAFNATHTIWHVNITVNVAGEFKARNADDATGTNAIWENHPDGPFSNWQLKVIGNPIPEIDRIDGASLVSGNTYFADAGTNVTIVAYMVNVYNTSADLYLVGDLAAIGGPVWDITNKSFPLTYFDFVDVGGGINVTYYAITITMPDATFEFKIGSQGDWAKSQGGGNWKLTSVVVNLSQASLFDVEGATLEVARDDENNVGARYRASINDTVRIWYRIYTVQTCDANCFTVFEPTVSGFTVELQGDDAGQSLGWTPNDGQLPFTYNGSVTENLTNVANITSEGDGTFHGYVNITNAAVAYYFIDYTIKTETVQFKAFYNDGVDRWEGASNSANNQLVAGMVWTSDIVGDVYNVGVVKMKFMASFAPDGVETTDVVGFGIWDGANWNEYNYTGPVSMSSGGNWTFVLSINLTELPATTLIAGQEGNMQVILYHYDAGLKQMVKQYDPQGSNSFTPLDGIPTVGLSGALDQGAVVTVSYEADGADSVLSSLVIDWGDGSTEDVTGTIGNLTHTYDADGKYTIVLSATTEAGGESEVSLDVNVDSTAPTADITAPSDGSTVSELLVTFEFSFSDAGGIKSAVLDFGDGKSESVLGTTSSIHQYDAPGDYTAKLTVEDNAGNSATVTVSFTIVAETSSSIPASPGTSSPTPFNFGVFLVAVVALSAISFYRRRR